MEVPNIQLFFLLSFLVVASHGETLLQSVLQFVKEGGEQDLAEPSDTVQLLDDYDFIIVGAGTAGCVLANRLTENPDWKVLLLEAGRSENYIMDIPILANYLQFTEANWKYKTLPSEKYCKAMNGKQCNWPRGKVMGGSSVLNYMIYTRGNRRDYDNWEKLGNFGWSYEDVLPYFKKIENFTIKKYQNSKYHSQNGYLSISYAPYRTKIAEAIVNSSLQYGMNYVDYNGATQSGVSHLQVTLENGIRESSSRAYLHPVKNRSNLHVKKYAHVTKILIDPKTKKTAGVRFFHGQSFYRVSAKKEIIVSAGAINSPQLLMLSGIGPKKHLAQMGIPLLQNLKVGYNLMDHVAVGGLTFLINEPVSLKFETFLEPNALMKFMLQHKGPLTIPGGCEVLTFNDLKNINDPNGYPNMELLFQGGSLTADRSLYQNFGITQQIYKEMFEPIEHLHSFMVLPMLLRPKSKGRLMLKDANYRSKPYIFPNYYAFSEDVKTMIEGIRLAINISEQPALQSLGAKLYDYPVPGCENIIFGSDAYWECFARHFTFTIYHQSGTCKMGPKTDQYAVVDPRLRVYGVKGLRVIDASIIPEIPAAHTNAPVFMIAEKGADLIKEDWGWK